MNFRWDAAVLVAVGTGTFVATLLSLVVGRLTPSVSAAGILVGIGVAVLAAKACGKTRAPARLAPPEWAALALFGLVAARQFGWLLFERAGEVLTLDFYNYGDLPLHITYIRFFANGAPFWPENPIFTSARLQYPIGIDVFQAMLLQLGLPLSFGLCFVGLAASWLAVRGLLCWGGALAVLAFLLSGGYGDHDTLAWKSLFLALFVPQRGFLFALPAGLLLLSSWRRRFLTDEDGLLPIWVEGLLWGVMPLFHLHTFALLSLLFAVWCLMTGRMAAAFRLGLRAVGPGTVGVLLVTDFFRAASLVGWKPGWTMGATPPALFFLANFTIYPALLGWTLWRSFRCPDGSRERLVVLPALLLWVALFFVKVAPWAWDNTKVMLWCYVLTLPAIGAALATRRFELRSVLLLAWLWPGTAAVADATLDGSHGYRVYEKREVDEVCEALRGIPPQARFAVEPTFNHPVALCGHGLVAGYGGHLWTYGIDPRYVEDRLRALQSGADWEAAARDVRARYLFWGPREAEAHPTSTRPWEASRRLLATGSWGRVYDLASAK